VQQATLSQLAADGSAAPVAEAGLPPHEAWHVTRDLCS
jgi:hypothetical protein